MEQLRAVQPPPVANEMTIADMVKQAHKGTYDLRERMLSLANRAGVYSPVPKQETAQNPIPAQLRDVAQDLLKLIASAHEAMDTLDRIA